MPVSDAFRDFELAGWGNDAVAISYHRNLAEVTSGCIPQLIQAAGVTAGHKVLDVACGAGYIAAAARDAGAEAIGVDFSPAQVRLAEQTYPDLRFIEGDAEALPFEDSVFDAVLNGFGMPHVPNPDKASAEAYRVLKPGGRFAYASWLDATKCVLFSMVYDAIREHGSLDVGLPPGPNFFSCGDLDYASDMLGRAGFTNVSITDVPLAWRVPFPDTVINAISSGTVRAATVLKRQNPADMERKLPQTSIVSLAGAAGRFAGRDAFMAHLEKLGLTGLKIHPDPVQIATEGALWGCVTEQGLLNGTVIVSDGAGQFRIAEHALCWVHAERLVHKLDAFCEAHRQAKERIRTGPHLAVLQGAQGLPQSAQPTPRQRAEAPLRCHLFHGDGLRHT